ncbi:uncharacterized protein LOC132718186 [Ruditapes philippinarum]|uniref:uncharacterized protein LOC132718186 n=1 Tax=Ruditapes philippinarum TaxID=129788 RepID=UPI00295B7207|nr:uncharacterized protein LOC132718186 [Ruditapes philippinarum]
MTTAVLVRSVCTNTNSVINLIGSNFRIGVLSVQPQKLVQKRCVATKSDVDATIKEYKEGNFEKLPDPDKLTHFRKQKQENVTQKVEVPKEPLPMGATALPHPIWSEEELHNVHITHKPPEGKVDKMAYFTVKTVRRAFDLVSGFTWGERNEYKWLNRIIFLETVAGVPGMVAAMTRHLHSLRRMQRDYGWIHTLLEEAENERMHLMTALQLKQPSRKFKWCVIGTQGVFVGMFSVWYLFSPRFCHRFVGYLEEEAVKTYTKCLEDIESGNLQHWKTKPSPEVAISYWNLPEDATMKDVILAIRADEAHHRLVNHTLASMKPTDYNPYKPGK